MEIFPMYFGPRAGIRRVCKHLGLDYDYLPSTMTYAPVAAVRLPEALAARLPEILDMVDGGLSPGVIAQRLGCSLTLAIVAVAKIRRAAVYVGKYGKGEGIG
jgi:transposase-like protein